MTANGKTMHEGQPPAKRRRGERYEVAFLGPQGTYGEQAARAFAERYYPNAADLIPCDTITKAYDHPAKFSVLPLQNTLQGGVLETLDCLLSAPGSSKSRMVLADLALPIRHCLVAKKGTRLEDVRWVRSHEQALGQSQVFLSKRLPSAKRQNWPSTAGAAVSLLSPTPEDLKAGPGAAIASKAILSLYPDELELLWEGTQLGDSNFTRFLLLGPRDAPVPSPLSTPTPPPSADDSPPLPTYPSFWVLSDITSLSRVSEEGRVVDVHARPVPQGPLLESKSKFPSRYVVEMEMSGEQERRLLAGDRALAGCHWLGQVREQVKLK
ncbi:hypothetical protein IAT38_008170 [Cryptococcus sp. DSM 104549]